MPQSTRQTSNVAKANVLLICDEDVLSDVQKLIYTQHEEKLNEYNKAVEAYNKAYNKSSSGSSGVSQAVPPKGNAVVQNGISNQPLQQKIQPQKQTVLVSTSSGVSWQQQAQIVTQIGGQSVLPVVTKPRTTLQQFVSPVNSIGQKTIIQVPGRTDLSGMQVISVPGNTGYQLVMAPQSTTIPRMGTSVLSSPITVARTNPQPIAIRSFTAPAAPLIQSPTLSQIVTTKVISNPISTRPVTVASVNVSAGKSDTQTVSSTSGVKRSAPPDSSPILKRLKLNSDPVEPDFEKNYYGYKKGRSWWDDEKPRGSFRCYVCNKKLSTNIRYMQHIKHHLDNEQQLNSSVNNVVNCRSCFKHFTTPYQLQMHVEKAHMYCKHRCGICEQACEDSGGLVKHLAKSHPKLQMPYVCGVCNYMTSFYDDLVSHFSKQHEGSKALMCPFCVRIIRCNNSFLRHCKTHLSVSMKNGLFRCRSCKLMFLNSTMLKDHINKDHVQHRQKDRNGVPQMAPYRGKQAINTTSEKNAKTVSKPMPVKIAPSLWTRKEIIRPKGALRCLECGTSTNVSRDHFRKKMACTLCKYVTYCGGAFANHMIAFHKAGSAPKVHHIRKITVNNGRMLLGCKKCEFSTLSPTLMACHIESCPRGHTMIESFKVRTSSLMTSRHFKREIIQIDREALRRANKKNSDDDDDDEVIVIEDEVLVDLTDDLPSTSKSENSDKDNESENSDKDSKSENGDKDSKSETSDKDSKSENGDKDEEAKKSPMKIGNLSVKLEKLPANITADNSQTKEDNDSKNNKDTSETNKDTSDNQQSDAEDAKVEGRRLRSKTSNKDKEEGDQPVNGKEKMIQLKEVQIKLEQISAV
ncbi:uncharacterized protein [Asterias amurensis]|uniref:uncharacterized protein n=1 Tax=Asterias amurensis TaxID=7602 RepID=UPI003AB6A243